MVPSTGMRSLRPSAKNSEGRNGMYLGWSCMSCRQPAIASAAAESARAPNVRRGLIRHLPHMIRAQLFQELARIRRIKLFVDALHAKIKLVARSVLEFHDVEQRMIRLRQSIQREHADYRRDRCGQDRALVRRHDECRPRSQRTSRDIQPTF